MLEVIKEVEEEHDCEFCLLNVAHNWIQIKTNPCHYLELHVKTGIISCLDADYGVEFAPPNPQIELANPKSVERIKEWMVWLVPYLKAF